MDAVEHPAVRFSAGFLTLAVLVLYVVIRISTSSTKASVPVAGSSAFFGYLAAWRVTTKSAFPKYIIEGYKKYQLQPFQIPNLRSWTVCVPGKFVNEVRKAPDDTLSSREELNDIFAIEYTMGKAMANDHFHVDIARTKFSSSLGPVMPAVCDEIAVAFNDEIGFLPDDEWEPVSAYNVITRVVCRASNRLFIGLPLCRNEEYTVISRDFTQSVGASGTLISTFPEFLRPLAAKFLAKDSAKKDFERFLLPIIEERRRLMAEYGNDWKEKPNDFMQWMLDEAVQTDRSSQDLARRMMPINFAAIHTTSMSFTHTLFNLAAYPEYIAPLREEVEAAINKHGWTKDGLSAMHRVDSFIKESMRVKGLDATSLKRKVLKPFTLSDGTTVQPGGRLAVNQWSVHHDPANYADPDTFDPFRFSRRVENGGSETKAACTTASHDFLFWGYGPHSCPGRYFAVQEMKAMLAHILIRYDVRTEEEGVRPKDTWINSLCRPDVRAKVLFRAIPSAS